MKTVACIIARTNSIRLPQKVLLEIKGKRMIEHIIDRIKSVKGIDEIYIATSNHPDDKILGDVAVQNSIKVHYGSERSVIDRMLEIGEKEEANNLLRITADNVFTDPKILELTLEAHIASSAEYSRAEKLPIGTTAEVIDIDALKRCYKTIEPDKSEYLFYYIFDPAKYKTLVTLPKDDSFLKEYASLTVDTPDDLVRTKFIFENVEKELILYRDILELNNDRKIPHFEISMESKIKLPNDRTIEYGEFRKTLDLKIQRSLISYY
ncbi:cytidylyltransferase domain-containing protein [Acetobacterium carbinolicum]|uniref:cytidylyltransferase domain-containing protein n=1 Tax=Acetobacterium carbinolicum TaxID=52690 RepID=UPI0039BF592A